MNSTLPRCSSSRLIAAEPGWRVIVDRNAAPAEDLPAGRDTYAIAAWLDDGTSLVPVVMWGVNEPVRATSFGAIAAIVPPDGPALADGLIELRDLPAAGAA